MGLDTITLQSGITKLSSFSAWANSPTTPSASTTYWAENGAVYQIMPNGGTEIIGFQTYIAYKVYCSKGIGWAEAPNSIYARTPFGSQDFPTVQGNAPNPNKNPTSDEYQVFAGRYTSAYARTFMIDAGMVDVNQTVPATIYTLISWAQASALSVQTTSGPRTLSLQFLALSSLPAAKNGLEIIWVGPPLN